jgi:aminopeptidase N
LALTVRYSNDSAFREVMRSAKAKLEVKNKDDIPVERAGPVWLGTRLTSSKFPKGYDELIYNKGAWIVHMLRYLLTDPVTGSDEPFRAVVREFLATYKDKLAGTEDLKAAIEKKLPARLNLEGNRKLDWFFDEWVYGMGIPAYRISYSVTAQASGGFLLKGKIIQEKVSEDFMMPVEVFAHYGTADAPHERLGRVVVTGKETAFHFTLKRKPAKVTLDDNQWILCDNKTL